MRRAATALLLLVTLALAACGDDDDSAPSDAGTDKGQMILATTTSTQDSGLLDELVPSFQDESGCSVKTIAVGSGEALELGEKGNADVLLVHSPESEQEYMDGGHGVSREAVMHNDFIVVGPTDDPAGIKGAGSAADGVHEHLEGRSAVRLARRRVGHPHEGAVDLGGGGDRAEGLLVHRDGPGDG